jgi:hypothetical protein
MKNFFLLLLIFLFSISSGWGQFSLYNTRTLYDSFENPAQKAFYADSSKNYAFNFLIPNLSINATITGPAQTTLKGILFKGKFNNSGTNLGSNEVNKIYFDKNAYIAMFKIFQGVRYHQELGFSWQIKSFGNINVTNETLALFNGYRLFSNSLYDNFLNNSAEGISYHQFAFTFREDYSRRLGLGVKLSYLSGIAYSKLDLNKSSLSLNQANKSYDLYLGGSFRSTVLYDDPDNTVIMPGFKNPGLALTLSLNHKMKRRLSLLANIKDLGFIKWSKTPYEFSFDRTISFTNNIKQDSLNRRLKEELFKQPNLAKFKTGLNTRAEILLSKDLNHYQPNLLISKSLFNKGGDIALINTFRHKALNLSLSSAYNLNNYFMLGGQFMLKSPNAEFFAGSDQIFKTYYTTKGILTSNENIGKNNTAGSVYFGFALKYGRNKERQQNANFIPMTDEDFKEGFFKRIFKKLFNRRRFEGERK